MPLKQAVQLTLQEKRHTTMINKKIGFIGAGNMASAIIGGLSSVGVDGKNLFIFDPNPDNCKKLVDAYAVTACASNEELVKQCEIILLAVNF